SEEMPSNFTSVKIISHLDQPLVLSDLTCDNRSIAVELVTNSPGQEFQVNLHTVAPFPTSRQQGHVTLKTSSTNVPLVDIPTYVNVQPILMTMPSIVRLPAPPLTNSISTFVQVRNY